MSLAVLSHRASVIGRERFAQPAEFREVAVVRDVLNRVVRPDEPSPDFFKAIVPDGVPDGFVLEFAKPQVGETA